jgi:hypothetical protein
MPTTYRLDLYNAAGALQAQLTGSAHAAASGQKSGYTNLAYIRRVNAPGMVYVTLRGDHELLAEIANNWQIEVWRKPESGTWRREITGIVDLEQAWLYTDKSVFSAQCAGLMSLLGQRHVLYKAGITNRSQFTGVAAETIMKTLVDYNAGPSATTGNDRLVNGSITGLTVQADGAGGNSLTWYCAYANLLETLQGIAKISGGDFDLVKTSPTAWQFRWYAGQLGTDRTASLTFALSMGNMASPSYRETGDVATVAVVGGQGEGLDRVTQVVYGANYHATANHKETFVNATDVGFGDTTGLAKRGDQKLRELEAQQQFRFEVTQEPTKYPDDYDLGDLVKGINPFKGTSHTLKVAVVRVKMDAEQGEIVTPEFSTP